MSWISFLLVLLVWHMSSSNAQMPCITESGEELLPKFILNKTTICLEWEDKYLDPYLKWQVTLLPQNPRIDGQNLTQNYGNSKQELCFTIPSYANQKYDLKFSCSFEDRLDSWTDDYYPLSFTTPSSVPTRPPSFVPNGFFQNPEKKELYVFWVQLNELEFNGSNFTYIVSSDTGDKATVLSNCSALFRNWDDTHSTILFIRSQNSMGPSLSSSQLKVPILTFSQDHQPQELRYEEDNQTIYWQAPKNQNDLSGYVVSWCSIPKNVSQICDDQKPIEFRELNASQLQFKFAKSMELHNVAVSAKYKDHVSEKASWILPKVARKTKETSTPKWGIYDIIWSAIILIQVLMILVSVWKLQRVRNKSLDF
ncbi:uncharacterized protein LOC108111960 [Drosophila eugracilis]|uniref:uncharacterized protein LOC108111960 n=1 Tax=Drosophila eugracilis TaxID=29029 RepID=UPI0007E7CF46|nr:uncharacterized protein LOC108111960 [Drosophila eugracilis]